MVYENVVKPITLYANLIFSFKFLSEMLSQVWWNS